MGQNSLGGASRISLGIRLCQGLFVSGGEVGVPSDRGLVTHMPPPLSLSVEGPYRPQQRSLISSVVMSTLTHSTSTFYSTQHIRSEPTTARNRVAGENTALVERTRTKCRNAAVIARHETT